MACLRTSKNVSLKQKELNQNDMMSEGKVGTDCVGLAFFVDHDK